MAARGRRLVESQYECDRQRSRMSTRRGRIRAAAIGLHPRAVLPASLRLLQLHARRRPRRSDRRLSAGDRARACSDSQTPREVDTLYFGGGTPTHLAPQQFEQLAETVLAVASARRRLRMDRRSQSGRCRRADDRHAPRPRRHAAEPGRPIVPRRKAATAWNAITQADDIGRAVALARGAGLHVALDLIFATPGETLDQWLADLDAAIALEPDHVSTYGLTFERGTAFWNRREHGELRAADEELERDMYAAAIDRLTAAGFEHYEVSNFARPGRRSRHNQAYWSGDGYFAAGPGAARYVDGVRETNHRSTTTYLHRVLAGESPVAEREQLEPEARARELLVFALRRIEGVSRARIRRANRLHGRRTDRRAAREVRRTGACSKTTATGCGSPARASSSATRSGRNYFSDTRQTILTGDCSLFGPSK